MKELEKTKRISIAAVLSILIIIIALLSYKRPKHIYTENTKSTLEKIIAYDYFVSLEDINKNDEVLIDVRNKFEFEKGHLENAINIYAPEILSEDNFDIFKDLKENNKTAILYGTHPNEVITPHLLLHQLGYKNIKILCVENSFDHTNLITKNVKIENAIADINKFIKEAEKKAAIRPEPKIKVAPKKVIPIKKKKKRVPEGGC